MKFYILTIEQLNPKSISIYGYIQDSKPKKAQIIIKELISPIYYIPNPGYTQKLITDLTKEYIKKEFQIEKVTKKNYFYDLDENVECIKLTCKDPILNLKLSSLKMIIPEFSNVVENFLISRNIKGPCLVEIDDYQESMDGKFYCEMENIVFKEFCELPSLKYLVVRFDGDFEVMVVDDERRKFMKFKSLLDLNLFVKRIDPDVLVYHNIHEDIDSMGRLVADIYLLASSLIKGRTFSISELCDHLKIKRKSELEDIFEIFKKLNILELYKQVTEICGNLLSHSLKNFKAEQVDYLLLNELYQRNILLPQKKKVSGESTYSGGLVFQPMTDFYESLILLLDFNSLYPSIIQEFNICFSTIGHYNRKFEEKIKRDKELEAEITEKIISEAKSKEKGILPYIFEILINRRRRVKELFKKTGEEILNIRQLALKLTANSIYGCLGSTNSRFYNPTMASIITSKGRQILLETRRICEDQLHLEVIYGDTDSIMINTHMKNQREKYESAKELSKEIIKTINKKYENLEIELEKIFKRLLLYSKKKYGALSFEEKGYSLETKGLDINRRDFCRLSNRILNEIFEILICDGNEENRNQFLVDEIKNKIKKLKIEIKNYPKEDFIISVKLSKNPESYTSPEINPYVYLANRLKKKNLNFKKGDIVNYIVGEGKSEDPIFKKVYHPTEEFLIDYQWYIEQQIFTPLQRILSIIDFISIDEIKEILEIKKSIKKTEITKNIKFLTPCCQNLQVSGNCLKCKKEVNENYYINKIYEILRKEISTLYNPIWKCKICNKNFNGFTRLCVECSNELEFVDKNNEFELFLENLKNSFSSDETDKLTENLMNISQFSKIDLNDFFKDEIQNGWLNK